MSGGFPIAGDYSPQYADIQARLEAARADPAAWSKVTSRFDHRAALGFYRELSQLPPNFLVDSLPCPLFAFWGEDDEEIASGGGVQLLASGLDRRRLKHASFPGHDHNGMLDHINEALPSVLAWFDELQRVKRARPFASLRCLIVLHGLQSRAHSRPAGPDHMTGGNARMCQCMRSDGS